MTSAEVIKVPFALGPLPPVAQMEATFAVYDGGLYRIIIGADLLAPLGATLNFADKELSIKERGGSVTKFKLYEKLEIARTPTMAHFREWMKEEMGRGNGVRAE